MIVNKFIIGVLVLLSMLPIYFKLHAYSESDLGRVLRTGNCIKCNLDGAPLSGVDLTNANLSGSSLVGANLQKATLYKAILPFGKYLNRANFTGAMWVDGRICGAGSFGKCKCSKEDWADPDLAWDCN